MSNISRNVIQINLASLCRNIKPWKLIQCIKDRCVLMKTEDVSNDILMLVKYLSRVETNINGLTSKGNSGKIMVVDMSNIFSFLDGNPVNIIRLERWNMLTSFTIQFDARLCYEEVLTTILYFLIGGNYPDDYLQWLSDPKDT